MKFIKTPFLAMLLIAGLLPGATAEAKEASGTMLAIQCSGCHGFEGVTTGPGIPSIAGMTEEYLVLSMKDYKADNRKGTLMNRIAKGYSDTEITAMAGYFAGLKFAGHQQSPDASLVARGKDLQQQHCESCHEESGAKADGIGILAGQNMTYLHYAIADFMSGDRPMERRKKQKMDQLITDEGEAGFNAIIHYYSSR